MPNHVRAIVIGDSTNNTLSIIRSLGEAKIEHYLILKCEEDVCFVSRSKYLSNSKVFHITSMNECMPILEQLKGAKDVEQTIICSFDEAAVFIDQNEPYLSAFYRTPLRGKQLGNLFDKDKQCLLAERCGLTVPKSIIFHRSDSIDSSEFKYPILLKPQNSVYGEKSDIHICNSLDDVEKALYKESLCNDFILQEFIDKEYELDCIGVRTEKGTFIPGGIRKIRHYPHLIGAGAFGVFLPLEELNIDLIGIDLFLQEAGYYGPFSVEFLHRGNKNYFMEVNFRNEGLAYVATVAGANLHALYMHPERSMSEKEIRKIYMMNYSLDFLYVKNGELSLIAWGKDFIKTSCFINFNRHDLMPTISYYMHKIKKYI